MPMKDRAVFSWRVATARRSLSLAQRRSKRLRLVSTPSGQEPSAARRTSGRAEARPGATRALGPGRVQRRRGARLHPRSRRPWCPPPARGQAPSPRERPTARPGPLAPGPPFWTPPPPRAVRPDARAVEERHPEFDAALLREGEQPLPHAEARPADEGLRRHPPRPKPGGDRPPLGAVHAAPYDRAHRPAQVRGRHLRVQAARLHQRPRNRHPSTPCAHP